MNSAKKLTISIADITSILKLNAFRLSRRNTLIAIFRVLMRCKVQ